ncbi:hypothetical protein CWI38_1201p0020, partial [Hamiltosporidium tvaerminnensis]
MQRPKYRHPISEAQLAKHITKFKKESFIQSNILAIEKKYWQRDRAIFCYIQDRNQGISENTLAVIKVDTRIQTCVEIRNNRTDIYILDKKKNMITVNEVEITYQDSVHIVKTEKLRRYDLLVNGSWLIYNCGME